MSFDNENLNSDFNEAIALCENKPEHVELIELLRAGTITQKQFAALTLERLDNQEEADVLLSNLVGQNGKVRTAVATKINEFAKDYEAFFALAKNASQFMSGVIDIDGNVCREIVATNSRLKENCEFATAFSEILVQKFGVFFAEEDALSFKARKYTVNKVAFKIYWSLEVLYEVAEFVGSTDLRRILLRTGASDEYTIREKTARILSKGFRDKELADLQQKLKQDENYYVRRW